MPAQTIAPLQKQFAEAENTNRQRLCEAHYLDTAQQAIWEAVQAGDLDAINTFLKISDRRVKLWGLSLEKQYTPQDWVVHVEYVTPTSANSKS